MFKVKIRFQLCLDFWLLDPFCSAPKGVDARKECTEKTNEHIAKRMTESSCMSLVCLIASLRKGVSN